MCFSVCEFRLAPSHPRCQDPLQHSGYSSRGRGNGERHTGTHTERHGLCVVCVCLSLCPLAPPRRAEGVAPLSLSLSSPLPPYSVALKYASKRTRARTQACRHRARTQSLTHTHTRTDSQNKTPARCAHARSLALTCLETHPSTVRGVGGQHGLAAAPRRGRSGAPGRDPATQSRCCRARSGLGEPS